MFRLKELALEKQKRNIQHCIKIPASRPGMTPEHLANEEFFNRIKEKFTAKFIKVRHLTDKVAEIVIKAPLAAKNVKPRQFLGCKISKPTSSEVSNTKLAMEGIAVTGT
jgi:hypothetical protein